MNPSRPRRHSHSQPSARSGGAVVVEVKAPTTKPWVSWVLLGALLLLVGLAYGPVLDGPLFFDDEHFIEKNRHVHDLSHIGEIYTSSVTAGADIPGNFYRPNQQMLFAIVGALFGFKSTVPLHALSVLLHLYCGGLLWYWARLLALSELGAVVAAGWFLLHPVQTEAVAYISGLADPLALSFILTALVWHTHAAVFDRSHFRPGRVIGICLLFVMGLLTKENAVVAAPILGGIILYFWRRERRRPGAGELALLVIVGGLAVAYTLARLTWLDFGPTAGLGLAQEHNAYTDDLTLRLRTFLSVLWDYARVLAWPRDLFYEKPYQAFANLASWRGVFGAGVIMAFSALVLKGWRHPRAWHLGAMVVALGMLPYTGIVPLNAIWLEHWLYLPMVGMGLALGALMDGWRNWLGPRRLWRVGLPFLLAFAALAAAARTSARVREWASPERFYLNEIAHGGGNRRSFNNLGMLYADAGDFDKSIEYYRRAIAYDQGQGRSTALPQPHHNLARVYQARGQTAAALEELRVALSIDPRFIYSLVNLYEIYLRLGDQDRAALTMQAIQIVQSGGQYDFAAFSQRVFLP